MAQAQLYSIALFFSSQRSYTFCGFSKFEGNIEKMDREDAAKRIADALEDYKLIRWQDKDTAQMIVSSFLNEYRKSLQKTIEDGVAF